MTQNEIKKQIDENNKKIEALFNPSMFILNSEINRLITENNSLRACCKHEFDENGLCIWCYEKREEES